jgi:hypothetical protein
MPQSKVATLIVALALLYSHHSLAQGPCATATISTNPTLSRDLICIVPQVYGPGGLVGSNNGGPLDATDVGTFPHVVHFQASSIASFAPLTSEIGTQLSQLPITSPTAGFIFAFNPSLGVVSRQAETFGPILTERAETIGKHKLYLGFSYQYFNFDKLDGVNLKSFGAAFQHEEEACPNPNTNNITCLPNGGPPLVTQDFVATQNRIDLKVHQFTFVGTFGLTDRLDLSLAIPILDVHMAMNSDATIMSFETAFDNPACCVHQFDPIHPTPGETLFPRDPIVGFNHAAFSKSNSSSGIGDLVFRGKFQVLKRERAGLSGGVDVHFPTGDAQNFLGSGTWGARPFVTFSYGGRISPHASLGYQINGNSILAGDVTTNTKEHLPNILTYSFGCDFGVVRRLSVSADYLGQTLSNAKRIRSSEFTSCLSNNCGVTFPPSSNISVSTATLNQSSIAVGGKLNLVGRLLLTANVLFKVNDAGLHPKPVPLIGISSTF